MSYAIEIVSQVSENGQEVTFYVTYDDRGAFVTGEILVISDGRASGRAVQRGVIGLIKRIPTIEETRDEDGYITYRAHIVAWIAKEYSSQLKHHRASVTVLSSALLDERIIRVTTDRTLPPIYKYVLLHGSFPSGATQYNDGSNETISIPHFWELNSSQQAACRKIVGSRRPIQLLHGPPGTG